MESRNQCVPADGNSPLEVERRIQNLGLTAPRITLDELKAEIVSKHFFTASDGALAPAGVNMNQYGQASDIPHSLDVLTFCVLVLRNGFTVTGESACASPENFNAQLGRDIAERNATDKIWSLLGFRLRDTLAGIDRGPQRDPSSRTRGSDPLTPVTLGEQRQQEIRETGDIADLGGDDGEPGKLGN